MRKLDSSLDSAGRSFPVTNARQRDTENAASVLFFPRTNRRSTSPLMHLPHAHSQHLQVGMMTETLYA
jgi:hypothetical protein